MLGFKTVARLSESCLPGRARLSQAGTTRSVVRRKNTLQPAKNEENPRPGLVTVAGVSLKSRLEVAAAQVMVDAVCLSRRAGKVNQRTIWALAWMTRRWREMLAEGSTIGAGGIGAASIGIGETIGEAIGAIIGAEPQPHDGAAAE